MNDTVLDVDMRTLAPPLASRPASASLTLAFVLKLGLRDSTPRQPLLHPTPIPQRA